MSRETIKGVSNNQTATLHDVQFRLKGSLCHPSDVSRKYSRNISVGLCVVITLNLSTL